MKICSGLFEHMVMQRNKNNACEQNISGLSLPGKRIYCLNAAGKELCSTICNSSGEFTIKLATLKTGGPYSLNISDGEEQILFQDIWVGDVWMLAGQSNMQGVAKLANAPAPNRKIRAFYMDNKWDIAKEPLHNMQNAEAEIHWIINGGHDAFSNQPAEPAKGVGPGLFFAKEMYKRTHIPQGVIASAHGGTTMEQWNHNLRDKGEYSLYGAMYQRFLKNGSKIAGLLWYQGCSDTGTRENTDKYEQCTLDFFKAVRRDFNDPDMPIVMVQLGRVMGTFSPEINYNWSRIREIQRLMPKKLHNLQVIPAIDLENDDCIHLSCNGHRILSSRAADAMESIRGKKIAPMPITPGKITCEFIDKYKEYKITIKFNNVIGKLNCPDNLPSGFSLHDADNINTVTTPPFCCKLNKKSAVIYCEMNIGKKIAFAFGCNPVVNIHDDAGRSLPAFGPIYFQPIYRSTPMLDTVEMSSPVMGDDSFDSILPDEEHLKDAVFEKFHTQSTYISPPRLIGQGKYRRYFRWQTYCKSDCDIIALVGADGPFRICCDNKEIAGFPNVANPIYTDEYSIPVKLLKGKHTFTLGLSGKSGNTWGFCLRYIDPADILTEENELLTSEKLPKFI